MSIIALRLRGGQRSARSGGKARFGAPIERPRREKLVNMLFWEILDDRSELRRFEVTGNPVLSPSIDGGIGDGHTDLCDIKEGTPFRGLQTRFLGLWKR